MISENEFSYYGDSSLLALVLRFNTVIFYIIEGIVCSVCESSINETKPAIVYSD